VIPYPHAGGHQKYNAQSFAEKGGLIFHEENSAAKDWLVAHLKNTIEDPRSLAGTAKAMRELAKPESTDELIEIARELIETMKIVHDNLIRDSRLAYLIGIGGSGMSGLARILKHLGLSVSGSDHKETPVTQSLRRSGIPVQIGQKTIDSGCGSYYLFQPRSVETIWNSKRRGGSAVRSITGGGACLALNHAETSIGVLGTHGKTTTTAMVSHVLSQIGVNPTCFVGSDMLNYDTNIVAGGRDYWVSEVDESDSSHEFYAPHYSIITNLEPEHLDHYGTWENLTDSFRRFLEQVQDPGLVSYFGDDPTLNMLVRESGRPYVNFWFFRGMRLFGPKYQPSRVGSEFDLFEFGLYSAHMKLPCRGATISRMPLRHCPSYCIWDLIWIWSVRRCHVQGDAAAHGTQRTDRSVSWCSMITHTTRPRLRRSCRAFTRRESTCVSFFSRTVLAALKPLPGIRPRVR